MKKTVMETIFDRDADGQTQMSAPLQSPEYDLLSANKRLEEENAALREALTMALQWIDALPPDIQLPTMPGFDRDSVDDLLAKEKP